MKREMDGRRAVRRVGFPLGGGRPIRAFRPALGLERIEGRLLLSASPVSLNAAGTAVGDGGSTLGDPFAYFAGFGAPGKATLDAGGRSMVFQSDATDLIGGVDDANGASDVFVRDLRTGQTRLVSATPGGRVGDGRSFGGILSPDGRYVAFLSDATDLGGGGAAGPVATPGGPGGILHVRDLQAGTTRRIDVSTGGGASDGSATGRLVFSPDGKTLAFTDTSTDLTATAPGDAPAPSSGPFGGVAGPWTENLYLHDLASGTTTAVNVSRDGTLARGSSSAFGVGSELVFSPDGRRLAFTTGADDLTDETPAGPPSADPWGGLPPASNLYVRDLATGATTLVSVTPGGRVASGISTAPTFSPDGDRLAFLSTAAGLAGETAAAPSADPWGASSAQNLYVRDLAAGTTSLASASAGGKASSGWVAEVAFSPDGRSLAFTSSATDLTGDAPEVTPGDSGGWGIPAFNVFVRDLASGTTRAVSRSTAGTLSGGSSHGLSYSPDGTRLAFLSDATTLTANPSTPRPVVTPVGAPEGFPAPPIFSPSSNNLYVYDTATGETSLVSVTPDGRRSDGEASTYAFSPDGDRLAFFATADDLTHNPPSRAFDAPPSGFGLLESMNVFLRDLDAGTTSLLSATPDGRLSANPPYLGLNTVLFGPDGRSLYFTTGAALAEGDANGASDIYTAPAPFAAPGEIHFSSWRYRAGPSDDAVTITVVRNAPHDGAASVRYAVEAGTADAGADVSAVSGTLEFAPGQASATFTVPLNPSRSADGTRTATLVLSDPTGAPLGLPTSTLTLDGTPADPPAPLPDPGQGQGPATLPLPVDLATTSTSTSTATPPAKPWTPTPDQATYKVFLAKEKDSRAEAPPAPSDEATPAVTTAATPPAPEATPDVAGPIATEVVPQTTRRGITGVVLRFNEPLDGSKAGNPANYSVHLLAPGRRSLSRLVPGRGGRSIPVSAAHYDPGTHAVSLTFRTPVRPGRAFELRVNGGAGGLTDLRGNLLNGRSANAPGADSVFTLNHRTR